MTTKMTTNENLMTNVLDTLVVARSVFNTCYHDTIVDLENPLRKDSLTQMISVITIMIDRIKRDQQHDNEQTPR
jgi:hypothetical protein